jgi:hypothetical protein
MLMVISQLALSAENVNVMFPSPLCIVSVFRPRRRSLLMTAICSLSKQERPENGDDESEFLEEGPVVEVLAGAAVRLSVVDDDGQHPNRHGSECLADIAVDGGTSAVTIIPVTLSPLTESE